LALKFSDAVEIISTLLTLRFFELPLLEFNSDITVNNKCFHFLDSNIFPIKDDNEVSIVLS